MLTIILRFIVMFGLLSLLACAGRPVTPPVTPAGPVGERYDDQLGEGEQKVASNYQSLLSKKGTQFVLRTFFPETKQITHYAVYRDRALTTPDGPYQEWYDSGQLWVSGQHENGQRSGSWERYHPNGQLSEKGTYNEGLPDGSWTTYQKNGALMQTALYDNSIKTGTWTTYWPNGQLKEEANYAAGEYVGDPLRYDSLGVLIPGSSDVPPSSAQPGTDRSVPDARIEKMPAFPGCEYENDSEAYQSCSQRKLLEFIYSRIRYPSRAVANDVEGQAIVSFVVEKDGRINEVEVLRGINRDIRAEVLRIVGMMPAWHPGEINGEAVRVNFKLPVKFKLE